MPPSTLIPWSSNSTPVLHFTSFMPLNNYTPGFRPQFRIPERREHIVYASNRNRSTPSIATNGSNRLTNGVRRNFFPAAAATAAAGVQYPNWMKMYGKYFKRFCGLLRVSITFCSSYFLRSWGDPIWAISSETISSLIDLSVNFFFILPLLNSVGIHLIDAPVLHPMSEGLFNFVIGWTFMFAPLLYTDKNGGKYKGSLDVLWGFQMFLKNTFLIPYMAIRLNKVHGNNTPVKNSQLGLIVTNDAPVVGLIGGIVCWVSILWQFMGAETAISVI